MNEPQYWNNKAFLLIISFFSYFLFKYYNHSSRSKVVSRTKKLEKLPENSTKSLLIEILSIRIRFNINSFLVVKSFCQEHFIRFIPKLSLWMNKNVLEKRFDCKIPKSFSNFVFCSIFSSWFLLSICSWTHSSREFCECFRRILEEKNRWRKEDCLSDRYSFLIIYLKISIWIGIQFLLLDWFHFERGWNKKDHDNRKNQ